MSVKIRLSRTGAKNNPHYRVIAKATKSNRDGKSLDILGHYNPLSKQTVINFERVDYWLSKGAKPTKTVERLLRKDKKVEPDASSEIEKKPVKAKSKPNAKK